MPRRHLRWVAAAGLAVGLFSARPAAAQERLEPSPVNVAFEFHKSLNRLRKFYDQPDKIEAEIADKLIAVLNKPDYRINFRWKFQGCDHRVKIAVPGEAIIPPVLMVTLTERAGVSKAWMMEVRFYDRKGEIPGSLRATVRESVNERLGIVAAPFPEMLPDTIATWFEDTFVKPDLSKRLHEELRTRAPIGEGLVLTVKPPLRNSEDAKGVLLLDFLVYENFAYWRFKVECPASAQHARIGLISEGTGEPYSFRPDGQNAREVQVIRVKHHSIIDGKTFPVATKLGLFDNLNQASFFLLGPPGPFWEPRPDGERDELQSADRLVGRG